MSGYTYLCSPYTHPDPEVREARFQAACRAAAKLMHDGFIVFSPIAHSHPVEVASGRVESGSFWKKQDLPLLRHADGVVVLTLEGWRESQGIAWEIEMAKALGLIVTYMEPV